MCQGYGVMYLKMCWKIFKTFQKYIFTWNWYIQSAVICRSFQTMADNWNILTDITLTYLMEFCCQFPAFMPYVKLMFDFSEGVMFSYEANISIPYPIVLMYVTWNLKNSILFQLVRKSRSYVSRWISSCILSF